MGRKRTVKRVRRRREFEFALTDEIRDTLNRLVSVWTPPHGYEVVESVFQIESLDVRLDFQLRNNLGETIKTRCRVRHEWFNRVPFKKLCPHVHLLLNSAVIQIVDPPTVYIPAYLIDRIRPSVQRVEIAHEKPADEP